MRARVNAYGRYWKEGTAVLGFEYLPLEGWEDHIAVVDAETPG